MSHGGGGGGAPGTKQVKINKNGGSLGMALAGNTGNPGDNRVGVWISKIKPGSPATGKIAPQTRIFAVDGQDMTNATKPQCVDVLKAAGAVVTFTVAAQPDPAGFAPFAKGGGAPQKATAPSGTGGGGGGGSALESEPWYHGLMERPQAEALLRAGGASYFLVRKKESDGSYAVSVMPDTADKVKVGSCFSVAWTPLIFLRIAAWSSVAFGALARSCAPPVHVRACRLFLHTHLDTSRLFIALCLLINWPPAIRHKR